MILIDVDLRMQVIVCRVCREEIEIPRSLLRDQQGLLELQEDTRRDHRECAKQVASAEPDRASLAALAQRNRRFRTGIAREQRKALNEERAMRRRCTGKPQ